MSYNLVEIDPISGEHKLKNIAGGSGPDIEQFIGTQQEWNDLPAADKAKYDGKEVIITDDYVQNEKLDIYSTDEIVVGRWIDGKSIYRKVVTNVSWSSGAWNNSIFSKIDVSTIDTPISILGIGGTVRANSSLQFDKSSGIRAEASAHNGDGTVILEYTKKD